MRKRLIQVIGVIVCGCSFQFLGCNSQDVADIFVSGVKSTAVDVSTFIVESVVDRAAGLN